MESKKINQLATEMSPAISDLTIIGDPITGVSKKITLLQIADLFQTTGTVTSVAVTETGDALTITGSPITTAGTINIGFAGAANQYVRGDGALADFPTSTGGGSSVSYYLNSSVSQGTIGGVAYRELSKEPIIGAGTDISISTNGYIASYITDANDPALLEVPGGNFNCELYFSVNSNAHNPYIYAELYKYDGTTFTLLGSSVAVPEYLTNGTTISPYYFAIPVPTSALTITDRLAIRIYANVDTRTVTLHTENSHLCQVVTTFSKGLTALNNLTKQVQYLATGTSGTNFAIVSSGDTHTFNLPVASATNTGKLSSTDWSTFNGKVPYTGATANVDLGNFNFDANNISGAAIIAKLNGPASSPFVLKSGSSGYTIGDDAISLISSPNVANTLILASNIGVVTKTAQFGLGSLTATRTFTLPDLSGTLALLEGTQTFTGAKTFSALSNFDNVIRLKQNLASYSTSSGYTTLFSTEGGGQYGFGFYNGGGALNSLNFTTGSSNTYTFPSASGTIALTSNIPANIVTGTGTTNTLPKFTAASTIGNSNITDTGSLITLGSNVTITGSQFVQNGFYLTNANAGTVAGYTHMWGANDGINFGLRNGTGGASFIFASANSYSYTFPAASGTLALTSNLSAYLPLTGGTLTGALNGTSATFSSTTTATAFIPSGSTIPTNGMYLSAANTLNFATNSLNRFTIASNGIATFGTDLYVNRNIYVNEAESGVYADFYGRNSTNTSTPLAFLYGSAGTVTWNNGGTKMTLTSAGALQLVSSLSATSATFRTDQNAYTWSRIDNQANNAAAYAGLQLGAYGNTWGIAIGSSLANSNSLNFVIDAGGTNTPRLTIASTGAATFSSSVTAGGATAIADALLPIQINAGASSQAYFASNNNGTYGLLMGYDNANGYARIRNVSNTALTFETNNSEKVRITSGGNVGIGTSSPANRLHVYNTAATDAMQIESTQVFSTLAFRSSTNSSSVTIGIDGAGNAGFENKLSSGNMTFATNATERMRITSGGNVLIGKSTTGVDTNGFRFDSNGVLFTSVPTGENTYYLRDTTNAVYRFYVTSGGTINATNTTISAISDVRLKENICDLEIGLDAIMALKPRQFDWKKESGNDGKNVRGFIAQEFEEVFPDLIDESINKTPEGEPYKQIRQDLIPILVKAIQEQQAQIESLKALINK